MSMSCSCRDNVILCYFHVMFISCSYWTSDPKALFNVDEQKYIASINQTNRSRSKRSRSKKSKRSQSRSRRSRSKRSKRSRRHQSSSYSDSYSSYDDERAQDGTGYSGHYWQGPELGRDCRKYGDMTEKMCQEVLHILAPKWYLSTYIIYVSPRITHISGSHAIQDHIHFRGTPFQDHTISGSHHFRITPFQDHTRITPFQDHTRTHMSGHVGMGDNRSFPAGTPCPSCRFSTAKLRGETHWSRKCVG